MDMISKVDHIAAVTAAVTGERARISSILNSDAAKGKLQAAIGIALAAEITAETASGILATVPSQGSPTFKLDGPRKCQVEGGLALVDSMPSMNAVVGDASDFDKGKQIAKNLGLSNEL